MAITTTKVLQGGAVGKSNYLDTVVDDLTVLDSRTAKLEGPPRAEIRRAASLTIATGITYLVVTLDDDGSGVRDPFGMWSPSSPTRLTIPAAWAGRWNFRAEMQWDFNGAGFRSACFTKNGGNPNAAGGNRLGQDSRAASTLTETPCKPEWEDNFAAGDYLQLYVAQNSGGNLGLNPAYTAPYVRVYARRVGPAL